jgi:hypothetical protein
MSQDMFLPRASAGLLMDCNLKFWKRINERCSGFVRGGKPLPHQRAELCANSARLTYFNEGF